MSLRATVTACLALAAGGCVLLVNDDATNFQTTCHFTGETAACGRCIATSCQKEVNGCCSDEDCRGSLSDLDTCATQGSTSACASFTSRSSFSLNVSQTALRTCVSTSCTEACSGAPTTSKDGGGAASKANCYDLGDSCSCTYGSPNTVSCTAADVEGGVCCADLGWPARDLSCRCERFACRQTSSGCECSVGGTGPTDTCTGVTCCAGSYTCRCGTGNTCGGFDEVKVPSCTAAAMTRCSGANKVKVDACVAR